MKLSEMLKKAEDKLKNEENDLITAPWQTTSLKKSRDQKKNITKEIDNKTTAVSYTHLTLPTILLV